MPDQIDLAPKIELHLHLEGAIPLSALWQLVQKYGGDPLVPTEEAMVQYLRYRDFPDFLDKWWWMTGFLREYEDFELAATSVAESLARQKIIYAEASFSPTDFERHGLSPQRLAQAIRQGLDRVSGTQVVLNCDLVRNTGTQRTAKTLNAVREVAAEADIRGITIGGSEAEYPPELFVDVYQSAADHGFRLTAHAGEAAGPSSVAATLDLLGVERIGHGIRTIEDPILLNRIVEEQIPLEVCPTSNIRTGLVDGWEAHPVGTLLDSGAYVTISSDDPTFFHTSVADDLRVVYDRYGVSPETLTHRAVNASWMTDAEKDMLSNEVTVWWAKRH